MRKKTRTIIFFICLFLFLIIAPSAILYSQGYRFNPETKKITQTGGLFLKIVPPSVKVYINGKLKDKTSLLFNSCLVENLSPRTYQAQARKEGYYPWQKNIEVKEKKVAEFKNIVLVPKNPNFTLIEKNIKNLWFSPSKNKVIYEKINKKTDTWSLEFLDLQSKISLPFMFEKDILQTGKNHQKSQAKVEIINIKWSPDEERVLLKINTGIKIKYFIANLNGKRVTLSSLDFLEESPEKISFNPKNPEEILFILPLKKAENRKNKDNLLFKVNYAKKATPQLILGSESLAKTPFASPNTQEVISYTMWRGDIIWLSDAGFLYRSNPDSGRVLEVLNQRPYLIKEGKSYQLITRGPAKTFLKEDKALYYLEPESREFKKVADNVKSLSFSPDLKKIVYLTDSEIWLFYLEKIYDQPQREAQEKIFLGRWANKINEVHWFTAHYLIFATGNKIKITETDNRDRINIVDLAEFPAPKLFWSQANKSLYILTNQNLITAKNLLP